MIWSNRRSSRTDTSPSRRPQKQQQPSLPHPTNNSSRRPSLSTSTTSPPSPRLPLAPLDPLDPQAAQTSFAAAGSDRREMASSSPGHTTAHAGQSTTNAMARLNIGRKIVSTRTADDQPDDPYSTSITPLPTRNYSLPHIHDRLPPTPHRAGTSTAVAAGLSDPITSTSRRPSLPLDNNPPLSQTSPAHFSPSNQNNYNDLHLYDSLKTFTFGAQSTSTSSAFHRLPIFPPDEQEDDLVSPLSRNIDVTPRPSVVGHEHTYTGASGNQQAPFSSHPPQSPATVPLEKQMFSSASNPDKNADLLPPPEHRSRRSRPATSNSVSGVRDHRTPWDNRTPSSYRGHSASRSDTASHHTFGTSSASASATSLSSADDSRTGSRASRATTNTTANTDDEHTDETDYGRDQSGAEFSSDDDYEYESDYEQEEGYQIEISSAIHEGSGEDGLGRDRDRDWELYAYGGGSEHGSGGGGFSSERRGSLPMAIIGTSGDVGGMGGVTGNEGFYGKEREGSLATLRRLSRSVDDDFRKNSLAGGASSNDMVGTHPLALGSASAPQNEPLDWKSLQEQDKAWAKERQKGKERQGEVASSALEGFDADWMKEMQGGITSLSPTEDIVRPLNSAGAGPRKSSWMSVWSVGGSGRRPSTVTISAGDMFDRRLGKWDGVYQTQKGDWSFKREMADSGSILGRGSTSARGSISERVGGGRSGVGFGAGFVDRNVDRDGEREREGGREKEKEKKGRTVMKGMPLGSQEIWRHQFLGRFKVDRRAAKAADPAKPPQQRLNVHHFHDPYSEVQVPQNGPPVTVHKHSKAMAFSISRFYKPKPVMLKPSSSRDGGRGYPKPPPSRDGGANHAMRSNMIMLAPRRVQEQYTSTTTTRKLESHGLLDDQGRRNHRERERKRKEEEAAHRAKMKLKRKQEKEKELRNAKGVNETDTVRPSMDGGSKVAGPPLVSALTLHTYPPGSSSSLERSYSSRNPASSSRTVVRTSSFTSSYTSSHASRRRDSLDLDLDSDELPSRTPHSEAFGTIDSSAIEQLRPRHDHRGHHVVESTSNSSLFQRFTRGLHGRSNASAPGPTTSPLDANFKPPWMTMAPRNKQEEQQRAVQNLNTSFKDVGLLPSPSKPKHPPHQQKKIMRGVRKMADIFEEVTSDSLYMLLPLWPGETDPYSEKAFPTEKPYIPTEDRQYLLVYYKPSDTTMEQEPGTSKLEKEPSKKRSRGSRGSRGSGGSRGSPTSSNNSGPRNDRNILFSSFHVSARVVGYHELLGTGVRVPDEGLSVTGPIYDAWTTMPPPFVHEENLRDFVIGVCFSRDAGMEFYPEGLVKMGLCLPVLARASPGEDGEEMEPQAVLSPIGRAVVEMAWLGCMALTSFGATP